MEQNKQSALLKDCYTLALLAGDSEEASRIVKNALERGMKPAAIYFEILGPALADIGSAWARGDLSIAGEHMATHITLHQIAYIRDSQQRRRTNGARAVATAIEGEMHAVGVLMIANLLHMEGWEVAILGQNTPTDALVELVGDWRPVLVILSLAFPDRIAVASQATTLLKSLEYPPAVFMGGAGMSTCSADDTIPADLITADPMEALRAAGELLTLNRNRFTLEDHLSEIGWRVQQLRRERGWSQQQLATHASLDRTYLSTVEQGKQNITIGAVVKIANALDTSLSELTESTWHRSAG